MQCTRDGSSQSLLVFAVFIKRYRLHAQDAFLRGERALRELSDLTGYDPEIWSNPKEVGAVAYNVSMAHLHGRAFKQLSFDY